MEVTVTIGTEEHTLTDATEQWITQQINRYRRDGKEPCVIVVVRSSGVNVTLSTPACGTGGGAGNRPPNRNERDLFDRWDSLGLNRSGLPAGKVVAFLKYLRRLS